LTARIFVEPAFAADAGRWTRKRDDGFAMVVDREGGAGHRRRSGRSLRRVSRQSSSCLLSKVPVRSCRHRRLRGVRATSSIVRVAVRGLRTPRALACSNRARLRNDCPGARSLGSNARDEAARAGYYGVPVGARRPPSSGSAWRWSYGCVGRALHDPAQLLPATSPHPHAALVGDPTGSARVALRPRRPRSSRSHLSGDVGEHDELVPWRGTVPGGRGRVSRGRGISSKSRTFRTTLGRSWHPVAIGAAAAPTDHLHRPQLVAPRPVRSPLRADRRQASCASPFACQIPIRTLGKRSSSGGTLDPYGIRIGPHYLRPVTARFSGASSGLARSPPTSITIRSTLVRGSRPSDRRAPSRAGPISASGPLISSPSPTATRGGSRNRQPAIAADRPRPLVSLRRTNCQPPAGSTSRTCASAIADDLGRARGSRTGLRTRSRPASNLKRCSPWRCSPSHL